MIKLIYQRPSVDLITPSPEYEMEFSIPRVLIRFLQNMGQIKIIKLEEKRREFKEFRFCSSCGARK